MTLYINYSLCIHLEKSSFLFSNPIYASNRISPHFAALELLMACNRQSEDESHEIFYVLSA